MFKQLIAAEQSAVPLDLDLTDAVDYGSADTILVALMHQAEAELSCNVVAFLKAGGDPAAVKAIFAPNTETLPVVALESFASNDAGQIQALFEANAESSNVASQEAFGQWARKNRSKVALLLGVFTAILTGKSGNGAVFGFIAGLGTWTYLRITKNAADPCVGSKQDFVDALERIDTLMELVKAVVSTKGKIDPAKLNDRYGEVLAKQTQFHTVKFGDSQLNTPEEFHGLISDIESTAKEASAVLKMAIATFSTESESINPEVAQIYAKALDEVGTTITKVQTKAAAIGNKFYTDKKDKATE